MDCPWSGFVPANLELCERSLCAFVTQPANAWSNVGFLVVGLWILRRSKRGGARVASYLGWAAIATGFGSTAFHATSTLVGQLMDQNAMFVQSGLLIAMNSSRWFELRRCGFLLTFGAALTVTATLLLAFPTWGIGLFVSHVVLFLGMELRLFFRDRSRTRYGALAAVGATFVVSWLVWWLDLLNVWCDPDNHYFSGHALWHLLGALSFVFWYRHYAQFTFEGEPSHLNPRAPNSGL